MSHSRKDGSPEPETRPPEDHFQEIYRTRASDYHRMISAEDVDGHILPALQSATVLGGQYVLDIGSGTGRIPLLIGGAPSFVVALDISFAMLAENRRQRRLAKGRWDLVQADMVKLPIGSGLFDLVIAGWAIGHQTSWHRDTWRLNVASILEEMERAAKPAGKVIILETLGTGATSPAPPTPELADYYWWLEGSQGFERTEIKTDYLFPSLEEAVAGTNFFFGDPLTEKILENDWQRLPEWTGMWSKTVRSQ